jgi:uncharacterized protein (TIGR02217 family)
MAFHNVRLPEDVERGAQGGPRFKTTILVLASGYEKRNIDWARTRAFYDIGYGIQSKADYQSVITFFYARQGRAHSFRFKDWADFEITAQNVGTTDGVTTTFQLFKRYTSGAINYDRRITHPVASGWIISVNGTNRTVIYSGSPAATEVKVDPLTGILTLGSTLAALVAAPIVVTGQFDVPVRFDTDELDVSLEIFDAGAIPNLPVIEVRGE